VGEPDFVTPWNIREAAIRSLERGHTTYTSNYGLESLRRAISTYVQGFFHVEYDPLCEILPTVGVSEAIDLALRCLLNPGDEVLYHEPCYVSYAPTVMMAYGTPRAVETSIDDLFALNPAKLEAAITPRTKVLMLNYPNNPTGAGMTAADKAAVAEFAVRHDLLVLSDEIYEELSYIPRSPSIATLPGMRERTIVFNGFSKAHAMTGYRIGYAVGPNDLIEAMMKIHQYSMLCAPSICQYGAIEALENGENERERMHTEYEQRRNIIVNRFNSMGLHCFTPRGAFYVFPDIRSTGMTSSEFATSLLKEERVAVIPGTAFGSSGEGFVRCSYATALDEIEEAMLRVQRFLTNHGCGGAR
jgi:aminotransferase